MPAQVSDIAKKSLAKAGEVGVQKDDIVIGVNGKRVDYIDQFVTTIVDLPLDGSPETNFTILRGVDTLSLSYTTLFDKKKTFGQRLFNREADKQRRIGFELYGSENFYKYNYEKFEAGPAMAKGWSCLLYTSPSPRDATLSRMPSSA